MKHSYNNPVFKTLFISLAFAVGVLFQGKAQNYSTGFQGATMVTTDACSDGNINWVVNSNTALQYPTAGAEQCYAQSLFSSVPNSYCLYGTDYNFNIPSNKVITGIEVRVYGWWAIPCFHPICYQICHLQGLWSAVYFLRTRRNLARARQSLRVSPPLNGW